MNQANNELRKNIQNVINKKTTQEKLRIAEKVFNNTGEGIAVTDIDGTIQLVNPAFTTITGYSAGEAIGRNPRILRSERHDKKFYKGMWKSLIEMGNWKGHIWNRRKNGETYLEWMNISAIKDDDGKTLQYVSVFHDLTENVLQEEHIKYQAYHDALTELPNRELAKDRLNLALTHAHKNNQIVGVIFLDIDRFKRINDTLGHPIGDMLLQGAAKRLREYMDEGDTVGRLGGDEFIILLEDIKSVQNIIKVVHKIFHAFEKPFLLKNDEIYVTASIGISIYPSDGENMESLMKNAEVAMYRAKEKGKNTYQLYTPKMSERAYEQLAIENDMYKALEKDEFILYYQPQVQTTTGEIIGAEALIRWKHPKLGLISPAKFIPLAEETGFIVPLGEWVLRKACEQNRIWQKKGLKNIQVAVNLSPLQFKQKDLIEKITKIIQETGIRPEDLELEITESNAMLDPDFTIKTLKALNNMGIQLAIDDFGTGYSSLAYFKSFPIHKIKIDQSFIRDINEDESNRAIVLAIIGIAKSLGLKSIAEGVETKEQLKALKKHGCQQIQGYFFSPPVRPEEFEKMLIEKQ
ncbi:putative bifunctional diguanylate cyclase/phosphodiesterase [Crassaminicella profunda]|uniref:putative bifunctional diguanylate cyclase/phosphodiesterase n=1 Tax=Crassaminicella profunda TaxID=1286698 RepID=UPI001CA69F9B|nr:EAL domain-containing protein [Crassaminicella profunda]QZY53793.1 EAL domain-containing protein [Crassaminicella profunda]